MSGTAFEITQGAERPTLPYYFSQAGTPVPLSGAGSVTFQMRNYDGTAWIVNTAGTVIDAVGGVVGYDFDGSVPVGEYRGHFTVHFLGASDLTGYEVEVRVIGAAPWRGGPGIRDGMGRLVGAVRRLVDDPPGPTQEFADWEIQESLDTHRRDVYDLEAYPIPKRTGGTVQWHDYPLNVTDWESGTAFKVEDVTGVALAPTTIDYQRGLISFAADTRGSAIFVTGHYFDRYYAGADLIEGLISRASRAYDVSMDGQSFARSQRAEMLRKRAAELRGKSSWASNARLTRPDMPPAPTARDPEMLTEAELREIRGESDDFLPNWVTVQRGKDTSDGGGGWEDGWEDVGRYRCRLGVPNQLDRTFADGVAEIAEWVVTLTAVADVRHGDRLLTGLRTLTVIGVAAGRSYQVHLRVACTEVR